MDVQTPREQFLIRTVGGPAPGTRIAPPDLTWPLPDAIVVPGHAEGEYVKTTESQLPPVDNERHVMRGAHYVWKGV